MRGQQRNSGMMLAWVVVCSVGCLSASAPPSHQPSRADDDKPASFSAFPGGRLIDLTHPLDEHTIFWPTAKEGFQLSVDFAGQTERGYYYAANSFRSAEHGGTHIDAPIHFFAGGQTVDAIPLERLVGPAVVVDVSRQCAADADYQVTVADLQSWEEQHRQPLNDVMLLIYTGYGRHWPDRQKYLGTELTGEAGSAALHFPGLAPEAARWLADHRLIRAVGIDTASIDYGASRDFRSHRILFAHGIPALENVAHLDQMPPVGGWLLALPMKIAGGSGAPTRIVGVVPRSP